MQAELEVVLHRLLPAELHLAIPLLASSLVKLVLGSVSAQEAQVQLSTKAEVTEAVSALAGQQVNVSSSVISFGAGSQTGDITIGGDVAGRDVVKLSLGTYIAQQTNYYTIISSARMGKSTYSNMMPSSNSEEYDLAAEQFRAKYCTVVARELDRLEIFGLPRMDNMTRQQGLSVAYVSLSYTVVSNLYSPLIILDVARSYREVDAYKLNLFYMSEGLHAHARRKDGNDLNSRPASTSDIITKHNRLIFQGEPGAGKSTLLQWLAIRASKGDFPPHLEEWNYFVPFFIRLRALVDRDFPSPEEFPAQIAKHLLGVMPLGWVHYQLERGTALVLIDGIDEIPRQQRGDVLNALQRLTADFPNACYILSSRPTGLRDESGEYSTEWHKWLYSENFRYYTIEPMNLSNIDKFIDQWHLALGENPEEATLVNAVAQNLKQLLRQRPQLRLLATNPLICAVLCAMHRERQETLPSERVKLYEETIEMLLGRRDEGRKIKIELDQSYPKGLSYAQKRALLQKFAYWLMQNGYSDVERERVDVHFSNHLRMLNLPDTVTGSQVRAYFVDRTGLLREPIVGRIDFLHRTFQEFLAAHAALDEDSIGALLEHATDDQWRETVIVAAGVARAKECDELLRGLVERGDALVDVRHQLHLLALACLETAVQVSPDLRSTILERAKILIPPRDEGEARLISRVGDIAVPMLVNKTEYSDREAVINIKALAYIGTYAAMNEIRGYSNNNDRNVLAAIGEAWSSFEQRNYAETVLAVCQTLLVSTPISSWVGFEHLKELQQLEVAISTDINTLKPLLMLQKLKELSIKVENPSAIDLGEIGKMKQLTHLRVIGSQLSDLKPLSKLNELIHLSIRSDSVVNLRPLQSLQKLQSLEIVCPRVSDIGPINHLGDLKFLVLKGSKIRTLKPLISLKKLTHLSIRGTGINNAASIVKFSKVLLRASENVEKQWSRLGGRLWVLHVHDE